MVGAIKYSSLKEIKKETSNKKWIGMPTSMLGSHFGGVSKRGRRRCVPSAVVLGPKESQVEPGGQAGFYGHRWQQQRGLQSSPAPWAPQWSRCWRQSSPWRCLWELRWCCWREWGPCPLGLQPPCSLLCYSCLRCCYCCCSLGHKSFPRCPGLSRGSPGCPPVPAALSGPCHCPHPGSRTAPLARSARDPHTLWRECCLLVLEENRVKVSVTRDAPIWYQDWKLVLTDTKLDRIPVIGINTCVALCLLVLHQVLRECTAELSLKT